VPPRKSPPPRSEEEAFLADVVEHPDDDTPRLVYADWLEDHGDADRAEFIRVQCELARLEGLDWHWDEMRAEFRCVQRELPRLAEWDERWEELKQREQRALRGYRPEWLGAAAPLVRDGKFRRGFLDAADVRPLDIVARGDELFRRTPLRHVRLCGAFGEPALRALADSPHLAWVRSLEFGWGRLTPAGTAVLAGSPHLRGLRELDVLTRQFGAEGARALAESPHLAGLTTLRLPCCDIGTAGAEALAASPHLARLQRLDLQDNDIRTEGARALARAPHMTNLTDLNLQGNRLSSVAVQALAEPPTLRPSRLDLSGNMLGERSARALVRSPGGARLSGLRFDCLGPPGVKALASSPRLADLTTLDLSYGHFGDGGARALAASPHLARLVELALYLCGVGDAGSQALLGSPHLMGLRRVDLRRNELGRKQKALWRARFGKNVSL
jgi:uncharacterized protein (TIGR02996 family)